jgi:hypothetical protein
VNPTSIAFTPPTTDTPPQVMIDPPNTFVGTLRVSVTASDGVNSDTERFSVQVNVPASAPDLAPIAPQTMTNNQSLDVNLSVTDADTLPAGLNYTAAADDYGYVLDQALSLAQYAPVWDNSSGLQEKWIFDAAGKWYFIHLVGNQAMLRRLDGDSNLSDDTLIAVLHRAYYDDPDARLVHPVSIAFTPTTTGGASPKVTIDPPDSFVGSLWVSVTVTDGTSSDTENFPVTVNASGGLTLLGGASSRPDYVNAVDQIFGDLSTLVEDDSDFAE